MAQNNIASLQTVIFPLLGFSANNGYSEAYNGETTVQMPQHSYTIDGSTSFVIRLGIMAWESGRTSGEQPSTQRPKPDTPSMWPADCPTSLSKPAMSKPAVT